MSGGDIGAREAGLSIMVGGSKAAFDRALLLLRCLGKIIVYQGPAGRGQHAKMVNQILIAAIKRKTYKRLILATDETREALANPLRTRRSASLQF